MCYIDTRCERCSVNIFIKYEGVRRGSNNIKIISCHQQCRSTFFFARFVKEYSTEIKGAICISCDLRYCVLAGSHIEVVFFQCVYKKTTHYCFIQ